MKTVRRVHLQQGITPFRRSQQCPHKRNVHLIRKSADTLAATDSVLSSLPQDIQNATITVKGSDDSIAYVLGISHCSQVSIAQIRQLISIVKPDAVLIELCKDRVPLLVDPDDPQPTLWTSPTIKITGVPAGKACWPTSIELTSLLLCQNGMPVRLSQLDDDAQTLLDTGLFKSVQVAIQAPSTTAAPCFVKGSKGKMEAVGPLGSIEFKVVPRSLPFSAKDITVVSTLSESVLKDIENAKQAAYIRDGLTGLEALLELRSVVANTHFFQYRISPSGVSISLQKESARGDDNTADFGFNPQDTYGIEPYKRQFTSSNMMAPAPSPGLRIAGKIGGGMAEAAATTAASAPSVLWRSWSEEEKTRDEKTSDTAPGGMGGAFVRYLTTEYAKYQAKAGRTVGIMPGAAWRAAFDAGAESGARLILLGDRPANMTKGQMVDSIWKASAPFLLGGVLASIAGTVLVLAAFESDTTNPLLLPVVATVPIVTSLWPLISPLLEIRTLSNLTSAEEIEDAVKIRQPILTDGFKLDYEDALVKWPGALGPIIHERDAFMAKSIAASILGEAASAVPAYVAAQTDMKGRPVWRLLMPKGGDEKVNPVGRGDGMYEIPKDMKKVVAVVGSAHVVGIWKEMKI